jgi:hypothetical protein
MISSQSRTPEWIMRIRGTSRIPTDPILIEKMILALTLLENLRASDINFIFKGGTSLLLVLGTPMRFSIDLDIVMETDQGLEQAIQNVIRQGVFHRFEEDERSSLVPKSHYKFFFQSTIQEKESSIMLDILFEHNPYSVCQSVAIQSDLVIMVDEPVQITCPAPECLLGDKLTAFAPRTTELAYSKLVVSTADVLDDCFNTACLIGMRGYSSAQEYKELLSGIKKMAGFVYAEHFTLDSAIVCAAKVAYLTNLIVKENPTITRFDPVQNLAELAIHNPAYNRLNKVKKTSPEAFFYFYLACEAI